MTTMDLRALPSTLDPKVRDDPLERSLPRFAFTMPSRPVWHPPHA